MNKPRLFLLAAAAFSVSASAATVSWVAGPSGDVSGAWNTSFNGQTFTTADDLVIDGSAAKTITVDTLALGGGASLTVSSSGATTLTGAAVGGVLTKTGTGVLTLASANTFGDVTVSGGKFLLTNAAGLGTTGTLNINSGAVSGVTGSYSSPGSNYVLDLSGVTTSSVISKNITFGTVASATTYGFVMKGNSTLTTEFSGNLTGASNITIWLDTSTASDGTSLWKLSGDNSAFSGTIRLNRGRIMLASANALGGASLYLQSNSNATNGNLTFNAGTTLLANNLNIETTTNQWLNVATSNVTLAGVVTSATSGSGGFSKMGTGSLTLTGANTYNGSTTTVADGILSVSGAGRLNSTAYTGALVLTAVTSVFDYSSSVGQVMSGNITGSGNITKSGTSTLTLSGANTYGGGTTITGGTVALGTAGAAGTGTISANSSYGTGYSSGGTAFLRTSVTGLNVANNIAVSSTAGYYALQMGAGTGGTVEWSGVISGGGTGVVLQIDTPNGGGDATSVATLSGNNTFSGQVRLNRGALVLANANAAGTASVLLQTNGNATDGNLRFSNSFTFANAIAFGTTASNTISASGNSVTLSGVISSSAASWSAVGTGTLTLKGANTFGGTFNINGGTVVTGATSALGAASISVANAGTVLRIGDGVTNGVTLGSGATLVIGAGATLRFFAANSAVTLAGAGGYTLTGSTLDLNNAFNAAGTYNLIAGGSGSKTDGATLLNFDSANFSATFSGGVLTVTAVPEPSTYGLLGAGTLALVSLVRRRRKSV